MVGRRLLPSHDDIISRMISDSCEIVLGGPSCRSFHSPPSRLGGSLRPTHVRRHRGPDESRAAFRPMASAGRRPRPARFRAHSRDSRDSRDSRAEDRQSPLLLVNRNSKVVTCRGNEGRAAATVHDPDRDVSGAADIAGQGRHVLCVGRPSGGRDYDHLRPCLRMLARTGKARVTPEPVIAYGTRRRCLLRLL